MKPRGMGELSKLMGSMEKRGSQCFVSHEELVSRLILVLEVAGNDSGQLVKEHLESTREYVASTLNENSS